MSYIQFINRSILHINPLKYISIITYEEIKEGNVNDIDNQSHKSSLLVTSVYLQTDLHENASLAHQYKDKDNR